MRKGSLMVGIGLLVTTASLSATTINNSSETVNVNEVVNKKNDDISVMAINGIVQIEKGMEPFIYNDRVLLPLKYMTNAFGAISEMDSTAGELVIKANGRTFRFSLSSNEYYDGMTKKTMDTEPMIVGDLVYVPIKYVFEIFDAEVDWAKKNRVVYVDIPGQLMSNINYYKYGVTGIGNIEFRSSLPSGCQVMPGGIYTGTGESILKLNVSPFVNSEELRKELDEQFGWIEDMDSLFEYMADGSDHLITVGDFRYGIVNYIDNSVGIEIYKNGAEIESSLLGGYGLDGIGSYVDANGDTYIPLVSSAKKLGKELIGSVWEKKLQFSGDIYIDMLVEDSVLLKDNIWYMEKSSFNKIFSVAE